MEVIANKNLFYLLMANNTKRRA